MFSVMLFLVLLLTRPCYRRSSNSNSNSNHSNTSNNHSNNTSNANTCRRSGVVILTHDINTPIKRLLNTTYTPIKHNL